MKNWFIGKGPDAGKDWRQEEKGATEDEMVGWHRWLSGNESEKSPEDSEGQRSPACCSPWGRKDSDMTERLGNNNTTASSRSECMASGIWGIDEKERQGQESREKERAVSCFFSQTKPLESPSFTLETNESWTVSNRGFPLTHDSPSMETQDSA